MEERKDLDFLQHLRNYCLQKQYYSVIDDHLENIPPGRESEFHPPHLPLPEAKDDQVVTMLQRLRDYGLHHYYHGVMDKHTNNREILTNVLRSAFQDCAQAQDTNLQKPPRQPTNATNEQTELQNAIRYFIDKEDWNLLIFFAAVCELDKNYVLNLVRKPPTTE